MARINNLSNFLTDVADSIRSKTGKSETITPADFDTEIESIETGGGGDTPEKGVVFSEWNNDGYPTKAETFGLTSIPDYYLQNPTLVLKQINHIVLNNNITSIGTYAFSGCTNLLLIELPNILTTIGTYAFYNCTKLLKANLPDSLNYLQAYAFYNCTNLEISLLPNSLYTVGTDAFRGCKSIVEINTNNLGTIPARCFLGCINLKKAILPKGAIITGTSTGNSAFSSCTGLKQVWIGSLLNNNGAQRYSFYNCTNLEKIYIDLPRATVEAFSNYQYAFMNDTTKTGIIVCNDDADFITQEEFEALEIE